MKEDNNKKKEEQSENANRREFIKNAGLIVGGAAIMSIMPVIGYNSTDTDGTSNAVTTTTTPATSSSTATGTTTPAATSTATSSARTTGSSIALDPATLKYSSEHIWVNIETKNQVRLGITKYAMDMVRTIKDVHFVMKDFNVDKNISIGEGLILIVSRKFNIELSSPISGTVIEVNDEILSNKDLLKDDTYGRGWLLVIKLNNPSELKSLMSFDEYIKFRRTGST